MATELGQAYVQIMPSARGLSGMMANLVNPEAERAGESAGQSLGSRLVKVATSVIAAAGIGKLFSASLSEGADLQQSLGGIETLFKGSADKVKQYASEAYKTSGVSANEYMENVTSFSASLLSSLGGDTDKAADVANTAMMDMSDNANKMGTNMRDIQNAYQGFAKQNYTMLDNLKLGYGGTKTEMQRLLEDAEKLTGVKYDIENLADVYNAIHAIQENLDITGTTAKEASETFSGSFAAMKAAAKDVMGGLSLGQDIRPQLKALAETTSTFLFDNFIPMVKNVIKGLPTVIGTVLEEGLTRIFGQSLGGKIMAELTKVKEVILTFYDMAFGSLSAKDNLDLLEKLGFSAETASKIVDIASQMGSVITSFYDMIFGSLSKKDNVDFMQQFGVSEATATQIVNIADNIRVAFSNVGPIIRNLADIVGSFVKDLLGVAGSETSVNLVGAAFEGVTSFIRNASEIIKDFTGWLKESPGALDLIKSAVVGVTAAWTGYKAVTGVLKGIEAARKITLGITNGLMLAKLAHTGQLTAAEAANAAATMGASGAFGIFNTILSLNPLVLVTGALAALTAGLVYFFSKTETGQKILGQFTDWLKETWSGIAGFFKGLWDSISTGASNLWTSVVETWQSTIETIKAGWEGIKAFFANLWEGIKAVASTAWSAIVQAIQAVAQPFIATFMQYWQAMSDGLSAMWEGIKMVFQGAWEFIKSIFMGAVLIILDLVTGNFGQLKADLDLIWESIKSAASKIWEGIKTYFSGVVSAIVAFGQTAFENFKNNLSQLWEAIKSLASATWEWIKTTVANLITGLVEGAQNTWRAFKDFLANLWEGIKSSAAQSWENLKQTVINIIDNLVSGAKRAWDNLTKGVAEVVDSVTSLFTSLGDINLLDAGRAIMDGFLGGLQDAWQSVQDFVGGIADWIRENKGPISYDRKLLVEHGGEIMGGLNRGLKSGFEDTKDLVSSMAPEMSDIFGLAQFESEFDTTQTKLGRLQAYHVSRLDIADNQQSVRAQIEHLQASVEQLLTKLIDKDSNVYLDGDQMARNSYGKHAAMMGREVI